MGHEIVYCFKCAKRLMSADFERGKAVRVNNNVACSDCAPSVAPGSSPAQQQKSKSGATVRPSPRTSRTDLGLPTPIQEKTSEFPVMLVGVGAAFVALIILVVLLLSGGEKERPHLAQVPDTPTPPPTDPVKPPDPPEPVENAEEKAWREINEAIARLKQKSIWHTEREEFGAALAFLEDSRSKYPSPLWRRSVANEISEVHRTASERFQRLTADEDLERVMALKTRIEGWFIPEQTRALETLIEDLNTPVELDVTNLVVNSDGKYELVPLRLGAKVFTDRDYEYDVIPAFLEGSIALKATNDDKHEKKKDLISFHVNMQVTLYVAHDVRIKKKPGWMKGFTDTGEEVGMSERPVALWVRDYPAGKITLGGNAGPRSSNTYIVFIQAAGK